jgi:cell division protein ZapA
MASIDIEVAGRTYPVACRDGEEAHLRSLASVVDRKARDAAGALGSMGETRQFLFASLLLADELNEARGGNLPAYEPQPDPAVADALERLAGRMEKLAEQLESRS